MNTFLRSRLVKVLVVLAAVATAASAQTTVASYLVGDYASTTTMADPVTVSSGITAGDLFYNIPVVSGQTPGYSSATDTFYANAATLPATLLSGRYLAFTLTVQAGYTMDLTFLSFNLGATNTTDTAYSVSAALRTSLDVGNDAGSSVTSTINKTGTGAGSFNLLPQSMDLSGVGSLQGVTGTATFYVHLWDDTNTQSMSMRVNNIVLDGSVTAIPEPSSLAVGAGLVGLVVAGLRCRRRWSVTVSC